MRYTGYALIAIGMLLFVFSGVSCAIATKPEETQPTAMPIELTIALVLAVGSMLAGVLILWFGGRGFSKTPPIAPESIK